MAEDDRRFAHYDGLSLGNVSEKQRREFLAKILRERKAQHDADQAEHQKLTDERHDALMQNFRESISRDDRFTDDEKAEMIKASYEW